MSATKQIQVTSVAVSVQNPDDWAELAGQIVAGRAMPTTLTPELIAGMTGTAVPLLFAADAARNVDLLRGTFADPVVAQCLRNLGCMMGAQPVKVAVHLVGAHVAQGRPVVRVHLAIQTQDADGHAGAQNQFWDLEAGGEVTVGQTSCPNCGAPLGTGELLCGHCHTDVRSVAQVPLVVSRLELY
jgi:ribosomal protein S27AE